MRAYQALKGLWELMTKIVTRENGTQSILVTILRLPSEPRVTLHLSTLKTKIVEKMGIRAKLISSPDNLKIVLKLIVFFSVIQYLHENMCIAIKCYLLENVIFIFYFFPLAFSFSFSLSLSFLVLSFLPLSSFPSSFLPLLSYLWCIPEPIFLNYYYTEGKISII